MMVKKHNLVPIRRAWVVRTLRDIEVGSTWQVRLPAGLKLLAEFDGLLVTLWSDLIPLGSARVALKAGYDYEVIDARAEAETCRAS